jgi:predicted N-acetyltransferase YhbS
VRIRPARPGEEAALTELAVRSKGHWGHDETFLARARAELTLRAADLERWIVRVADRDGAVIGFSAVDVSGAELQMLFVEPSAIGTGAGGALLADALGEPAAAGLAALLIESDPDAEPFYRRFGAVVVGSRVSPATGRELPSLRIATGAPANGGH